MRFFLMIFLSLFTFAGTISAQDSTFSVAESFRINQIEEGVVTTLKVIDLDSDGISEIIGVAEYTVERIAYHRMILYRSGELSVVGDLLREPAYTILVNDFNSDGRDDIVIVTRLSQNYEVYLAPEFNLSRNEQRYYVQRPVWGGNRILQDGNSEPFAICSGTTSHDFNADDTSYHESYSCGMIWQGTWENDEPEHICNVVKPMSIIYKPNEINGGNLSISGYSHRWVESEGPNNGEFGFHDAYFQLMTNTERDFADIDSLVVFSAPMEDYQGNSAFLFFGFGYDSELGDFNNDGELEWYVPYWTWDGEDIYQCHILSVDPVTLDTATVFCRRMDDFTAQGASSPIPIRGIVAIDNDEDGEYQLLLAMQNHPLLSLDCETMEVVAESDFILPDNYSSYFDVGYFDESGKLQMLIQDEDGFVIYNLFEEPGIISENKNLPFCLYLDSPHPNPFNSSTTIGYSLPAAGNVSLAVYDLSGREVVRLADGVKPAGKHEAVWSANGMATGLYFARLEQLGQMATMKLLLVK